MVERQRTAEFIHVRHDLLEVFRDGVEEGHLIEQTLLAALSARSIVALNIDYERVVQLTQVLNSVEDPAHLIVGIGERRGINLHHVRVDLLVVGIERVPRRGRQASAPLAWYLRVGAPAFSAFQRGFRASCPSPYRTGL